MCDQTGLPQRVKSENPVPPSCVSLHSSYTQCRPQEERPVVTMAASFAHEELVAEEIAAAVD
jgi:hypothetical protein